MDYGTSWWNAGGKQRTAERAQHEFPISAKMQAVEDAEVEEEKTEKLSDENESEQWVDSEDDENDDNDEGDEDDAENKSEEKKHDRNRKPRGYVPGQTTETVAHAKVKMGRARISKKAALTIAYKNARKSFKYDERRRMTRLI